MAISTPWKLRSRSSRRRATIDTRLLPEGFLRAYRDVGGDPPADFLEAYELLCEVLYYGTRIREDAGRISGSGAGDYFFGEPRLLDFKGRVDSHLAAQASQVRRWATARKGQEANRPRPADPGRGDLAGAGGVGDRCPDPEKEA